MGEAEVSDAVTVNCRFFWPLLPSLTATSSTDSVGTAAGAVAGTASRARAARPPARTGRIAPRNPRGSAKLRRSVAPVVGHVRPARVGDGEPGLELGPQALGRLADAL